MPPRAKYTREEILQAAFEILRSEGPDALTARYLGEKLGGSARPIFTVFSGMQEVLDGALDRARQRYGEYLSRGLQQIPPFKGVGMEHIRFAVDEPRLFREIFQSPANAGWGGPDFFMQSEENCARVLESLTGYYGLPLASARALYTHLWYYTHGIASLMAAGVIHPDMETVSRQLTEVFSSLLPRYQKGEFT